MSPWSFCCKSPLLLDDMLLGGLKPLVLEEEAEDFPQIPHKFEGAAAAAAVEEEEEEEEEVCSKQTQ